MDPALQREIASKGGKAAHEKGTAHEFTSAEAREAGRKGGEARAANNEAAQARRSGAKPAHPEGEHVTSNKDEGVHPEGETDTIRDPSDSDDAIFGTRSN